MKKFLCFIFCLCSATSQAQSFASINAEYATRPNGASDLHGYLFTIGQRVNNNLIVDANAETLIAGGSNATVNRLEAGASWLLPTGSRITPYVRTALGTKTANGSQFNYYSIEPGLRLALGPGTAKLGWRYRDAVESGYTDQSRTWRGGYVYPLTNNLDANMAVEQSRGVMDYTGYMFGLSMKF